MSTKRPALKELSPSLDRREEIVGRKRGGNSQGTRLHVIGGDPNEHKLVVKMKVTRSLDQSGSGTLSVPLALVKKVKSAINWRKH